MGLTASQRAAGLPAAEPAPAEVVWHDLECGGYSADLPLWSELADQAASPAGSRPILDIGAGTGRVSLELARRGHRVTALDAEPGLLEALRVRAEGLPIMTTCADARTFALEVSDFALCLVPMQTLQLLGGSAGRLAFLGRARAHMRPGALLACAIVTELEAFDCSSGDPGPEAESAHADGCVYISRPVAVRVGMRSVAIERERQILPERGGAGASPAERDIVKLDRVKVSRLEQEALQADLRPAGLREIPATEDHVGSVVVMLRA